MGYSISLGVKVGDSILHLDERYLDVDYTYNVAGMFSDVIGHSIHEWHEKKCFDVSKESGMILSAFLKNPDKYIKMNPENGWGDFYGARKFIQTIHDACLENPEALVLVY